MNKYIIKIKETISNNFIIEANSEDEALEKIKNLYKNEVFILYPEQCDVETEYELIEKDIL